MSYSPWGKIDLVSKYIRGVSFVSTPSHGGFRVSLNVLKTNAISLEYLLSKAIVIQNYAFFEEDCLAQLFLADCPSILKLVADKQGKDAQGLLDDCMSSVKHWYPDYFELKD